MTVDEIPAHEARCPFARISCPFIGCGTVVLRRDLPQHLESNMGRHLAALQSELELKEARLRAAEARAEKLEVRVGALEEKLSSSQSRDAGPTSDVAALRPSLSSRRSRRPPVQRVGRVSFAPTGANRMILREFENHVAGSLDDYETVGLDDFSEVSVDDNDDDDDDDDHDLDEDDDDAIEGGVETLRGWMRRRNRRVSDDDDDDDDDDSDEDESDDDDDNDNEEEV
jgi:hypothetical protein